MSVRQRFVNQVQRVGLCREMCSRSVNNVASDDCVRDLQVTEGPRGRVATALTLSLIYLPNTYTLSTSNILRQYLTIFP